MSELREVLARAMRAQGKADPDEVFAKADELLEPSEPPDPEWAGEHEQPPLPLVDELTLDDDAD